MHDINLDTSSKLASTCWLLSEDIVFIAAKTTCLAFYFAKTSSYLVDPASSHMLVSKIKPCMSKYILFIK